jgi:GTPase
VLGHHRRGDRGSAGGLTGQQAQVDLAVDLSDGAAIAWLYDHGQVLARRDDERKAYLRVRLDNSALARFQRRRRQPEPAETG